jgi:hypothetical protein
MQKINPIRCSSPVELKKYLSLVNEVLQDTIRMVQEQDALLFNPSTLELLKQTNETLQIIYNHIEPIETTLLTPSIN